METTLRLEAIIRAIPKGRVASYSSIARAAGIPNGARQVARLLHSRAEGQALPWHRVVRKDGSIALPRGGGFEIQKGLLAKEGVEVQASGRIDLERYGCAWDRDPGEARAQGLKKPRVPKGRRPEASRASMNSLGRKTESRTTSSVPSERKAAKREETRARPKPLRRNSGDT